jgi:hypothetical protein
MKTALYWSVPAFRCSAPAKRCQTLTEALQHAEQASRLLHMPYAIWRVSGGRMRLVRLYTAVPKPDPRNA